MSRIFITGDTHGDIDRKKLDVDEWPEQNKLTKDDYLIIAGDVAMRWCDTKPDGTLTESDSEMIRWYNNKPFTTLFIDGNHENHHALNSYLVSEWNGGKVHRLDDSVYHLMRGQVYNINGYAFFTMGGARSVDIYNRRKGISWWPEEMPSRLEYEEAISNLEKNNMSVDYVITHCCGTSLQPCLCAFDADSDELTQFFDHLEFDFGLKFKHWYFGHYHRDKRIDDRHTCLYYRIIEL